MSGKTYAGKETCPQCGKTYSVDCDTQKPIDCPYCHRGGGAAPCGRGCLIALVLLAICIALLIWGLILSP